MSDRLFFAALGVASLLLVALALVWPQGLGARSPGPFGHVTAAQAEAQAEAEAGRAKAPPKAAAARLKGPIS